MINTIKETNRVYTTETASSRPLCQLSFLNCSILSQLPFWLLFSFYDDDDGDYNDDYYVLI